MKIKTSELTGAALDWAVCMAKGMKPEDIYIQRWGLLPASLYRRNRDEDGKLDGRYTTGPDLFFSRKWEAGGPIIDRERIGGYWDSGRDEWDQVMEDGRFVESGPTKLVAAMRCYVASKLGDEVEIPEELLK